RGFGSPTPPPVATSPPRERAHRLRAADERRTRAMGPGNDCSPPLAAKQRPPRPVATAPPSAVGHLELSGGARLWRASRDRRVGGSAPERPVGVSGLPADDLGTTTRPPAPDQQERVRCCQDSRSHGPAAPIEDTHPGVYSWPHPGRRKTPMPRGKR